MRYDNRGDNILVRLDVGDEVIKELASIARNEGVSGAHISGIGALRNFTLGFYDIEAQKYKKDTFNNPHELTNATGLITVFKGEPHVHIHATLAGPNHQAVGGHLHAGVVSAAGEFVLRPVGEVSRKHIDETGLDILNLSTNKNE